MKIGMFSDPHYSSAEVTCSNRFNSRSLGKIERAMRRFAEEKCDIAVILGDITDTEDSREKEEANLRQVADVLKSNGTRTVCLMGNHDAFVFTEGDFFALLGTEFRPENVICGGLNLVFIDACYFSCGRHYMPGDSDWTDTFFPHTKRLRDELAKLDGEAVVFMHQNIDPNIREDHRLSNADEVRRVLEESGKVMRVFQGHYHPGMESVVNGIRYTTLPAMCENEDAYFIFEI